MHNILKQIPEHNQREAMSLYNSLSDTEKVLLEGMSFKNAELWFLFYWISPFFWLFDRLILGSVWWGLLKLTLGLTALLLITPFYFGNLLGPTVLFGIMMLSDGFTIVDRVKSHNYHRFLKRAKILQSFQPPKVG